MDVTVDICTYKLLACLYEVKVEALLQCQKLVYLYRIRLKPLFLDYDKVVLG